MWSGPRNISTALMRAFGSRSDVFISDEPFYGYYLYNTNIDHPMKNEIIEEMEISFNIITKNLTGNIPQNKSLWYQKHMAHHMSLNDNLMWIKKLNNILLIRNPREVILSYIKKNTLTDLTQLGLQQQLNIYKTLKKINANCIIIDANDLVVNPKKILEDLCNSIGVIFDNNMLKWKLGPHDYDGVWGKHWYNNVNNSTEFTTTTKKKNKIPDLYLKIYKQAMNIYNVLKQNRMK